MDKYLVRTKAAIEDCESHLLSSGAFGTEIESYLTQHILVILCADMQQDIYRIAADRAKATEDNDLINYVSVTAKRVLRSVKKDEIATYVGMFGAEAKKKLNGLVQDNDVTTYNAAVRNRHDVAHSQGVQITFRELKQTTTVAERLLQAVAVSLSRDVAPDSG